MNTKLLSVAIPCYNSAAYMERAIQTSLAGGDGVEILIVDDGSTDETAAIGFRYAEQYPGRVRFLHKENGGHGDAVTAGLREATGLYFKVLDSDDWFDEDSLVKLMQFLEGHQGDDALDMIICNYVYEKVSERRKVVIDYKNALPVNVVFGWEDIGHFRVGQYLLMHAVVYRRQLLTDIRLTLPKHTFYVDNLYVYYPLPYVKRMCYLDLDLYRYYIGREDQSVNEKVMIGRIDQQLKVTRLMLDKYNLSDIKPEKLREYMTQYLTIIVTVSSALLVRDGSEESLYKKEALWGDIKYGSKYRNQYYFLNKQMMGLICQKNGRFWNRVIKVGYVVARKVYHFN